MTPAQKAKEKAQQQKQNLKSWNEPTKIRREKRKAMNAEAQAGLKGSGYKKDISRYDASAYGQKKFGGKDVEHLQSIGYSNKDIKGYVKGLESNQLTEGFRHNNALAGKHRTADLAKGSKIKDHDVGGGFNMADVKYLQAQGFKDEQIAKAARRQVLKSGKKHGKPMAKWMKEQGKLSYKYGAWDGQQEDPGGTAPDPNTPDPNTPDPEQPTVDVGDTPVTDDTIEQNENDGSGVGDTGLSGKAFVNYFADAGKTEGIGAWADNYAKKAQTKIDGLSIMNTAQIDKQLNQSIQNSSDEFTLANFGIFGDYKNKKYKPPVWENSAPEEVEKPDFEDLADKYKQ